MGYALRRKRKVKCPFCDVEMIQGYLQCGSAIWSTKKHKISVLPNKTKEKYAFYLKPPLAGANYVESACCPNCKRIIIDSTNYENNLGTE